MNTIVHSGLALDAACLWWAGTPACLAQSDYPSRPIRILIPFPAAVAADTIGRSLGNRLPTQLGHPIVGDTEPGAAGRLATEMLARAEPVGGTPGELASLLKRELPKQTKIARPGNVQVE